MAVSTVTVSADTSAFAAQVRWLGSALKTGNILERIPSDLQERLHQALAPGRGDELVQCGDVSTGPTGDLVLYVIGGPLLDELEAALRALGIDRDEVSVRHHSPPTLDG